MEINIKKFNENAIIPTYGSELAAGCDVYADIEKNIEINPGETKLIGTGIGMEIPRGYVGLVYARSGLATKKGLAPANKVGVIDADYRGEIMVALHNHSNETRVVEPKERIAQLVIAPYIKADFKEVNEFEEDTERGTNGFGSTGIN